MKASSAAEYSVLQSEPSSTPSSFAMGAGREFLTQAGFMWLAGFREACCLHRIIYFCRRSRTLSIRTGQCFLLNGLIFLGSICVLNSVIIPSLRWMLPKQHQHCGSKDNCCLKEAVKLYTLLQSILIELFYIFWFYPLYVFSLILSTIWYNDIAAHAFTFISDVPVAAETSETSNLLQQHSPGYKHGLAGVGGVIVGLSEQIYSLLLLNVFLVEVWVTSFLPYVGNAVSFILLSWIYAYYCFEYKWNILQLELERRLNFFESNWAFFSGFGSPCVMAMFFFSRLLSYGVMATLFPLFVLTAMGTQVENIVDSRGKSSRGGELKKFPVFYTADAIAMKLLQVIFNKAERSLDASGIHLDQKLK